MEQLVLLLHLLQDIKMYLKQIHVVELSDLQKELDDLSVSQEALMEENPPAPRSCPA